MIDNAANFLAALGLVCLVLVAFLMGRQSHKLHLSELTAAISIAKQDIGWTYERYRLQVMRMDWVSLPPEIRKEYIRMFGRPAWAHASEKMNPQSTVAVVRSG